MTEETMTLEEYKKYLGDENISDEEARMLYQQQKEKFDNDVEKIASGYQHLNMDTFVERIGGQKKIDEMKKINSELDKYKCFNGNISKKEEKRGINEDLEEWKKGFMDGFEEAYKRLNGSK